MKYGNRQPLTLAMLKVRFGVRLIVFELFPAMSTVSLLKMLIQNNWCSLGKTLIAQSGWRWEKIVFFPVCPSFLAQIVEANFRT